MRDIIAIEFKKINEKKLYSSFRCDKQWGGNKSGAGSAGEEHDRADRVLSHRRRHYRAAQNPLGEDNP